MRADKLGDDHLPRQEILISQSQLDRAAKALDATPGGQMADKLEQHIYSIGDPLRNDLDVYDHYAWRYWLETKKDEAWHFLKADDSWQDAYFAADNSVKSAELNFWLSAVPKADALPTMHATGSTRLRPALQKQTGGLSPAVRPHAPKRGLGS